VIKLSHKIVADFPYSPLYLAAPQKCGECYFILIIKKKSPFQDCALNTNTGERFKIGALE